MDTEPGRWRRWREKRWARLLMDGALLVVVFAAISLWQTRNHPRGDAQPLALRSLDGALVTSDTLKGKPTLVVFWAPWCRVCHANADNVARVASWSGARAQVVSVASEYQDVDEVRRVAAREGVQGPILLGGDRTARAWGVQAFPTFFFLDADGRITTSVTGYTTTLGLAARLLLGT